MKKFLIFLLFLIVMTNMIFSSCKTELEFNKSSGAKWSAGYGMTELIIPDMDKRTYYLAGFSVDKKVTGIIDNMFARAVWLDDNSGSGGIVIATVDCIGLPNSDVLKIRSMLKDFIAESGCRSVNIIGTHDHAAVDTLGMWGPLAISGRVPEFMNVIYDGVVSAVRQAYESRGDGKLYYSSINLAGMQNDSRPPVVFDENIHTIYFHSDTRKSIMLVNYAAHAEAMRSQNTMVSADFPGHMIEYLENSGYDSMYIPAAIGGLITTKRQQNSDGSEMTDFESTGATGRIIASKAIEAATLPTAYELSPSIGIISKKINIPLENSVFITSAFLGTIATVPKNNGGRYNLSAETEIGYLELGEKKICLIPGELLPELAYGGAILEPEKNPPLIKEFMDDDFLIFGLCNDEIGYIIPPGDFLLDSKAPYIIEAVDETGESHYEETNSMGPHTAEKVIGTLEEIYITSLK